MLLPNGWRVRGDAELGWVAFTRRVLGDDFLPECQLKELRGRMNAILSGRRVKGEIAIFECDAGRIPSGGS